MKIKLHRESGSKYFNIYVGLTVLIISLIISSLYTGGDQIGYKNAYSLIEGLGIREAFPIYDHNVSSPEYMHFLITYIGVNAGISKDILMSVLNGLLAACSFKIFKLWGVDYRVSCLIIFSNFYFLVLYFAAERLKIGFIFLTFSLLHVKKPFKSYALAIFSIWSHFSLLFIYSAAWIHEFYGNSSLKTPPGERKKLLMFLLIIPPLVFVFYESKMLFWKLGTYVQQNANFSLMGIMPIVIIILMSGVYARDLLKSFFVFAPITIFIIIMGGSRLNMLAYFIFLSFALRVNGGINLGVLISSLYMLYKSIGFMSNVLDHGHGFT